MKQDLAGSASLSAVPVAQLRTGLMLAVLGAIGFSGKAVIVKLAYRYPVDAITLLMLRMLFSLPLFLALAWWSGRGKLPLTRRDWLGVAGLGFIGYYLSSFLDFMGLFYISASLERLILYLNPTLVLLLGWLLYGKRFSRLQLLGAALSYAGALVVFGHELSVAADGRTAWGALLVLGSTVTYAIYLVYSSQLVQRLGALRLAGLATSVACVCCIAQYLVMRPADLVLQLPAEVLWLSLLNATVCTVAPVLMVMMAIERIGAGLTAQTGMIGPLSTIVMGVLLLGESFTPWVAAGTVLVVGGIYVFTRGARRV